MQLLVGRGSCRAALDVGFAAVFVRLHQSLKSEGRIGVENRQFCNLRAAWQAPRPTSDCIDTARTVGLAFWSAVACPEPVEWLDAQPPFSFAFRSGAGILARRSDLRCRYPHYERW